MVCSAVVVGQMIHWLPEAAEWLLVQAVVAGRSTPERYEQPPERALPSSRRRLFITRDDADQIFLIRSSLR